MKNENLEKNYNFFKNNLDTLLKKYNGDFLVIQNEKILFNSRDMNLIAEFVKTLESGTYIIQRCESVETQFYTFHSWVDYNV